MVFHGFQWFFNGFWSKHCGFSEDFFGQKPFLVFLLCFWWFVCGFACDVWLRSALKGPSCGTRVLIYA